MRVLPKQGNFLLYDDDCGICTTFSRFIGRILGVPIVPMHIPEVEKEGISKIGEDNYWKSFHVVKKGRWTTEDSAIVALASLFPLGKYLEIIAKIPPVLSFLVFVLRKMQKRRSSECKIDFSSM